MQYRKIYQIKQRVKFTLKELDSFKLAEYGHQKKDSLSTAFLENF
jgi:hypothetical protein